MPSCRDVGHAYSIFLRMYTAACGFALMGIAVFVIVSSIEIAASVESDDCATGELFFTCPQVMQLALGVIALAIFEVLFGGLIVAAEFHVKIVARYFGFMCTYVGKGLFVFFCGVVVASLGLAYASFERGNIAPVVIGSCMLAAGVLQMLCVVPCCGFKADPLKLEFRDHNGARVLRRVRDADDVRLPNRHAAAVRLPAVAAPHGAAAAPAR